MKIVFSFFMALVILILPATIQAQEAITNKTVIEMVELGLDDDIIITKINTSDVNFDSSLKALKNLKSKGVSSAIISLIAKKSRTKTKTGIYYSLNDGSIKQLQPSTFTGSKSNNMAASATFGIVSNKTKSYVANYQSPNKVSKQEFIFMFSSDFEGDQLTSHHGNDDWWFKTATSPNEFVLVRLTVKQKRNQRELVTGKGNQFTGDSQQGVEGKNTISFSITDLGSGKFQVIPNQVLTRGEYCFFYQGTIPQGGYNNQSIFDFSIQ